MKAEAGWVREGSGDAPHPTGPRTQIFQKAIQSVRRPSSLRVSKLLAAYFESATLPIAAGDSPSKRLGWPHSASLSV